MSLRTFAKRMLNSRLFTAAGLSIINYDLLKYTKHYFWIVNLRKIPVLNISYNKARDLCGEDISLCQRLIDAYHKAVSDRVRVENDTSRMWSYGIKRYYGKLISILESADVRSLAGVLSTMFRDDFVYGLASGSLIKNAHNLIGAKIWSMKYQDNVVALAEYLGVVRSESNEQGIKAHALKDGMDAIVAKIEAVIGVPMDFPDIGAPYGIKANNSLITMEHPEHVYVALRVSHAVWNYLKDKNRQSLNVVEIGGGFGDLAYWMTKLKKIKVGSYTIIDLPLINILQGYFLGKAFGASNVKLYGETFNNNAAISVLPTFAFEKEIEDDIDVLINENSMPEMSDEIVKNYIRYAKKRLGGIFFSYNHEAYSVVHGKPQVLVPEIIKNVGGFQRLSRNVSWVRSSYVEEVYRRVKKEAG